MRANFRIQRLFVEAALGPGLQCEANGDQFHYLANVLRMEEGAPILLFNGRDGEWMGWISYPTRKRIILTAREQARPHGCL